MTFSVITSLKTEKEHLSTYEESVLILIFEVHSEWDTICQPTTLYLFLRRTAL